MKICVADNLFKGIIHKVPFFERYSEETMFLNECMTMLEPLLLMKGDLVYEKGEQANMVYFLIQGRVNFVLSSPEQCFKTFVAGSYFGEIEIFRVCVRLFSVKCSEDCQFMTINREYFV